MSSRSLGGFWDPCGCNLEDMAEGSTVACSPPWHGIWNLGADERSRKNARRRVCLMDRGETDATAHVWLIYLAKNGGGGIKSGARR